MSDNTEQAINDSKQAQKLMRKVARLEKACEKQIGKVRERYNAKLEATVAGASETTKSILTVLGWRGTGQAAAE